VPPDDLGEVRVSGGQLNEGLNELVDVLLLPAVLSGHSQRAYACP
jgi:hypothetical protein